jgi:hypothetical protein
VFVGEEGARVTVIAMYNSNLSYKLGLVNVRFLAAVYPWRLNFAISQRAWRLKPQLPCRGDIDEVALRRLPTACAGKSGKRSGAWYL